MNAQQKPVILKPGDSFDIEANFDLLTAAGKRIAKDLADFLRYYEKAKRAKPEVMRIAQKNAKAVSWTVAAAKVGERAEFHTLRLNYGGIPVEVAQ